MKWIESFLRDRTQRIVFNGNTSEWSSVLSGVPQGSVLGPLLFNIYVNDLHLYLHSRPFQYADDTFASRVIRSNEDVDLLQYDIESIASWSKLNCLSLNVNKCQVYGPYQRKGTQLFQYIF